MRAPKSVRAAETAQTTEVKIAGEKAYAALLNADLSDSEANAIIIEYNAMPNAVKMLTREEYRKA